MNSIDGITPLKIHDIDFTVARQIEQCPKTMMLRELLKNAIEAAERSTDAKRVVIKAKAVPECGDSRKLAIWNTGPGMTASDLLHICDLAASIGKDMGLSGNFGMGAKVASLPSNPLGMRYRSCHAGVVSQVILGKRDGRYGRVWVPVLDEETGEARSEEVVDVTEVTREEGEYSLAEDWTEVVLFGATPDQDTVADPYAGDPEQDRQWITTGLYHRFYYIPEGVSIELEAGTHPRDGIRTFQAITQRLDRFGRNETVEVGGGLRVHYLYDPPYKETAHNLSISGNLTSSISTAAVVFRGEMYDLRKGRKWAADAPTFGIPFGGRHISIHVELPDEFQVRPEAYRRFLQYAEGDQRQVSVEDFAGLVVQHRPEWLIDIINSFAPKSSSSTADLRQEMQKLLNELRVRSVGPRLAADGEQAVAPSPGGRGTEHAQGDGATRGAGGAGRPTGLIHNPLSAKRASVSRNLEYAPEIFPLRDEAEIADKEISGKAARYVREPNHLFVNMLYSGVDAARDHLERRYAGQGDPEVVRLLARQWADRIIMGRVGFAVVYAQAKQLLKEWTPEDVRKALEPECLSLAADGWRDAISSAYVSISRRVGAPSREEEPQRELV